MNYAKYTNYRIVSPTALTVVLRHLPMMALATWLAVVIGSMPMMLLVICKMGVDLRSYGSLKPLYSGCTTYGYDELGRLPNCQNTHTAMMRLVI